MKNYCIGSRLYVVLEALNTSHLSDLTKYATLPFCHRFFAFTVVVLHTFFITSHNRHSTCLGFNHMTRNLIIWIHLAVFKRFEMTAWVTSKDSPNSSTYLSEKSYYCCYCYDRSNACLKYWGNGIKSVMMVAITFPIDRTDFAFFGASSPGEVLCFAFPLVSCISWSHVSVMVAKGEGNSFGLFLNSGKHRFEVVSHLRLLYEVSKRCTLGN